MPCPTSKAPKCSWRSFGKRKKTEPFKLQNSNEMMSPDPLTNPLKTFPKSMKRHTAILPNNKKLFLEGLTNHKKNDSNSSRPKTKNSRWSLWLFLSKFLTSKSKMSQKNFSSSKESTSKSGRTSCLFCSVSKSFVKFIKSRMLKFISRKYLNWLKLGKKGKNLKKLSTFNNSQEVSSRKSKILPKVSWQENSFQLMSFWIVLKIQKRSVKIIRTCEEFDSLGTRARKERLWKSRLISGDFYAGRNLLN